MLPWNTRELPKKHCRGYRRSPNWASGSFASMRRTSFGVVPETRQRLPDRRQSVLLDLEHQCARYDLCVGLYLDGRPAEVFLSGAKSSSDVDGLLADLGVLLSRALRQYRSTRRRHGQAGGRFYACLNYRVSA